MTTTRLYYTNSTTEATGLVTEIRNGDNPGIVLKATIFHPQGGGQKADQGWIGDARVLHVANEDGVIVHQVDSVEALIAGQQVSLRVHEASRRLHSRLHTAGHLIAAELEQLDPRLKAVAGHHWPGEARVDLEAADFRLGDDFVDRLGNRLEQAISSDAEVIATDDSSPPRTVRIGSYAPLPCGGTHVQRIGEIGAIKIRGVKLRKKRIRVGYDVEAGPTVPIYA